jgi:hypothetical protein
MNDPTHVFFGITGDGKATPIGPPLTASTATAKVDVTIAARFKKRVMGYVESSTIQRSSLPPSPTADSRPSYRR